LKAKNSAQKSVSQKPKPVPSHQIAEFRGNFTDQKSIELGELLARLAESEEALRAISGGEVDAVVVTGKKGRQIFSLEGANDAYRLLIESMNEGAITLGSNGVILYANHCFAKMVKTPLEQVVGSSFFQFVSNVDQVGVRSLLKNRSKLGSKIQVKIITKDNSTLYTQISIHIVPKTSSKPLAISMVVTDVTEARDNEEMLRALTQRLVAVQEAERARVAFELHDGITQMLCAILFHSQALVGSLAESNGPAKKAALKLNEMAAKAAEEVECISRNLRPSVLENLGLIAALRDASTQFAERSKISVNLNCVTLIDRLPLDTELALYRILQEALRNVEKHAHAHHITIRLTRPKSHIQLTIKDDGIGFNPHHRPTQPHKKGGLGLLSMRERAAHLGGSLKVKSLTHSGTEIIIRIPLPPSVIKV
jgi:two-component system, NarL family, sensor kinase